MITDHMFMAPVLGREDVCQYEIPDGYDTFCARPEAVHVPAQPDGISEASRDLPNAQAAAGRVRAYIRESGDGLYDLGAGQPLYARDLEALCRSVSAPELIAVVQAAIAYYKSNGEVDRHNDLMDSVFALLRAERPEWS